MSADKKRVLFWSGSFHPYLGGVETLGGHFLPRMRSLGYDFIVVTTQGEWNLPLEDEYTGIPVYRFPFWKVMRARDPVGMLKLRGQIAALKRSFQPDLVHVNSLGLSAFFHLLTREAFSCPTLVSVHQDLAEDVNQIGSIQGDLLRMADLVTCVSDNAVSRTLIRIPELAERTVRIYNGLPAPQIEPDPLDFTTPTLLCIGRLVKGKGFDTAIQAIPILLKQFPGITLKIVGDGPERAVLQALVEEFALRDAVRFLDWVAPEKISGVINQSTLVLVPSLSNQETFGLVALEAAQMGRPVVASQIGGLPEVVLHEQTGLLVPPGNPATLSHAILYLLRDQKKAELLGIHARKRALETFGFDSYIKNNKDLYQKIFAK